MKKKELISFIPLFFPHHRRPRRMFAFSFFTNASAYIILGLSRDVGVCIGIKSVIVEFKQRAFFLLDSFLSIINLLSWRALTNTFGYYSMNTTVDGQSTPKQAVRLLERIEI